MRPTSCPRCMLIFTNDSVLEAEIAHMVRTEGEGVARLELDERLAEQHTEHER